MRARAGLLAGLILTASPSWSAVTGRVLDADGKPLAGAAVSAYGRETAQQRGERYVKGAARTPLASTRAGTDGTFKIDPSAGVVWIEALAAGCVPAAEAASDIEPVELKLARAKPRRGTVTSSSGKPLAAAVVVWTSGAVEVVMRSGGDGTFELPQADSGSLLVVHPDHALYRADLAEGALLQPKLDEGVVLRGSVVDDSGRPAPAAELWLDDLPRGTADASGAFRIAHAARDWTSLATRLGTRVGVLARQAEPFVVTLRPGRSLSGSVRDAKNGRPLAGAFVTVSAAAGEFSTFVDTNARGEYSVADLPAGRYRAYAGRPGYDSGPSDWMSGDPLDLRGTPVLRRDFALDPQARVKGRVVDEDGKPVDLAWVGYGLKDTPYVYVGTGLVLPGLAFMQRAGPSTRSAADGSFSLPLPPQADDVTPPAKDRPLVALKQGFAAGRLDVTAGAVSGERPALIRLARGVALAGRVTTADGAPLAGVAVDLSEDGALAGTMMPMHMLLARASGGESWAVSDQDGRFSVRVHPRVHHLFLRKSGFAPKLVRDYDPRQGQPLEVALDPAAVVRGRVARADGRGVAGVTISLSQQRPSPAGSATTGDDGTFEIGDLAPGTYGLQAEKEELGIDEQRTIEAPVLDLQVLLQPSVDLRGHVVDAATRQPVTRFVLRLSGETLGAGREVQADDATGGFTLTDLPSGDLAFDVSAEGYATQRVEGLSVSAAEEPPTVEVALETEGLIRGRVTSDGSAPIADAFVSAAGGGREIEPESVRSDDDGQYEVRGLAPGDVKLVFRARGFSTEKRTLDTRLGNRLDVVLSHGLALRGDVVADGIAVPKAEVLATPVGSDAMPQSSSADERGRFLVEGLVPGHYTVTAQAEQGSAKLENVDVEHAGPLRLVLQRRLTAVLSGKVVGLPPGDGVIMAMVIAESDDGQYEHAMVDAVRAFRIEDVAAGHVKVSAIATTDFGGATRSSRPVEVTLAPGTESAVTLEFSNEGSTISGTVRRDGVPVAGAQVSFSDADEAHTSMRTDIHGLYEVTGLDPGRYRVAVQAQDIAYVTQYDVAGASVFDIDVTGAGLRGRVVRAADGTPVAGVEVSLFRAGEENSADTSATTSAQGEFTRRALVEGRYRLVTSKAGFGQEVRELELARGETVEVLVELTPAEGVSVTVVDARDGRALDAIVVVRDTAKRIVANRHSGLGEDGVLNIPLAPGSYLLSTSATGFGTATQPVNAPAQGLRLALTPGGTLVVESPKARGQARLVRPDGEEYVRCWCNGIATIEIKNRRTTVENITPGSYTFELLNASEPFAPQPVVIREGQASTLTLE